MAIHQVEKEVDLCTTLHSPLLECFFQSFMDMITDKEKKKKPILANLKFALERSRKLPDELQVTFKLCKISASQVDWGGWV